MIERISNQNNSNATRITPIEKVNPSQPVKDLLDNTEKQ